MSIWFKPVSVAELQARTANTLITHLGIVMTEVGDDFVRATMPVDQRTHQPFGLLHGGASVALAESLGGFGSMMTVDESKFICVGQEINANHLRGVKDGVVTATARPIHLGGTSQVWGIEIRNAKDQLVCISRLTVAIRPKIQ